ncbi:hypothetical protein [Aeromicrobium sp. CF3.5]|uniref:hypothetical protein n=1 Tax=Aeromicrobium sp. CF3.5 TaxID=3373078 RepID=UPI003EE55B80
MKLRWVVLAGLVTATLLLGVVVRDRTPLRGEYCAAEVGEVSSRIDLEQGQWSSLMAAMAQQRGLPPRATTIAIATAFQESKIRNIDYGDRDSLGLFQQRPSQGWGTPEEILDPVYSIGAFYDGLQMIDGYEELEITDAAQQVQRSAFPLAYADHEDNARALASSLRGFSPAAFTCQFNPGGVGSTQRVIEQLQIAFGDIDVEADGDLGSYQLDGAADDVEARGWGIAHYLVGNAQQLGISRISFDGRLWTDEDSPDGWQPDPEADSTVVRFATN